MYVGRIVSSVRERTDNTQFAKNSSGVVTEGVSTDLILEFINDAQEYLQGKLIEVFPSDFTAESEIDIEANVEGYSIPDNIFIGNKIVSIEYSHSGLARDYLTLVSRSIDSRDSTPGNQPRFYIRRSGQVLLNPIPLTAQGKIRANYYRALDRLDIRRGKITSKTATTIVLADDSDLDSVRLALSDYLCIVDRYGAIKDYNIQVSGYDSGTRTVTIPSSTLVGAANDYVVDGRYTTTHPTSNSHLHRYFRVYAQKRLLLKDESVSAVEEDEELLKIENQIIAAWSVMQEDPIEIPVLDESLR